MSINNKYFLDFRALLNGDNLNTRVGSAGRNKVKARAGKFKGGLVALLVCAVNRCSQSRAV